MTEPERITAGSLWVYVERVGGHDMLDEGDILQATTGHSGGASRQFEVKILLGRRQGETAYVLTDNVFPLHRGIARLLRLEGRA